MKVNTHQSFFPTKITSHDHRPTNIYKVVKKRPVTCKTQILNNREINTSSHNIFTQSEPVDSQLDFKRLKPVGGMETFMKELKKNNEQLYLSHKGNDLGPKREENYRGRRNERLKRSQESNSFFDRNSDRLGPTPDKQETFKSHQTYSSKNVSQWKTSSSIRPSSSVVYNSKFRDTQHHEAWAKSQATHFQTQMAYKNQFYYKKPLVEKYGNKYFEYFVRNRHEDESDPPMYIHQIDSKQREMLVNKDRFISKLRKINPALKNYEMLKLRGKKVKTHQEV